MYYKLAPSVLAADFTRLGEEVRAVDEAGAQYIHLDVMDGAFVPSISFGMPVLAGIREATDRVFDVHMMVEEPGRYVEDMRRCGADHAHGPRGGLHPSGPGGEPDQGGGHARGCGIEPGHADCLPWTAFWEMWTWFSS